MSEGQQSWWARQPGLVRQVIVAFGIFWFLWLVNALLVFAISQINLSGAILSALATIGELIIMFAISAKDSN